MTKQLCRQRIAEAVRETIKAPTPFLKGVAERQAAFYRALLPICEERS